MKKISNFWSQKKILKHISISRNKYSDLYLGEKILIEQYFKRNFSVLDIGCSQGGFISILKKINTNFRYTGLDYNNEVLTIAKKKFPKQKFLYIKDNKYSKFLSSKFDLVIIFGILHLNNNWKEIIKEAYKVTRKYLIFDLRESNKKLSKKVYLKLDGDKMSIPYYINHKEQVRKFLNKEFKKKKILNLSYEGYPTKYCNYKSKVIFSNYCLYK